MRRKEYQQKHRLYFNHRTLKTASNIEIEGNEFNYIIKVLRLNIGSSFFIFNENNGEFLAEISSISKKSATLIIQELVREPKEDIQPNICLVFAPLKQSANEIMLQKATELGVKEFLPIITERSIVRKINKQRLQKIILEATEQSERICPPKLHEPVSLTNALKTLINGEIIFCDESLQGNAKENSLLHKLQARAGEEPITKIYILIGAEGGFSNKEAKQISAHNNVIKASLGANILKAETAALTAIAIAREFIAM